MAHLAFNPLFIEAELRWRDVDLRNRLSILFSLRQGRELNGKAKKGKAFNPLFIEALMTRILVRFWITSFNPLFIEARESKQKKLENSCKLSILFSLRLR